MNVNQDIHLLDDQFQRLWDEYQALNQSTDQTDMVQLPGRLWLPLRGSSSSSQSATATPDPVKVSDVNACQALCSDAKCGAATFNQVTKYCWTYVPNSEADLDSKDKGIHGSLQVDDDSVAILSRQTQLLQQMKELNRHMKEMLVKEQQQQQQQHKDPVHDMSITEAHAQLLAKEKKVATQSKQLDELSTNLWLQQSFVHQMASRYQLWLFMCCVFGLAFKGFKPISVVLLALMTATWMLNHGAIFVVLWIVYWIL